MGKQKMFQTTNQWIIWIIAVNGDNNNNDGDNNNNNNNSNGSDNNLQSLPGGSDNK